jgi:hypothetical protein
MNALQQYVFDRTASVFDGLNETELNEEINAIESIDKTISGVNAKRDLLKDLAYNWLAQASDSDIQTVYPDFYFDFNLENQN